MFHVHVCSDVINFLCSNAIHQLPLYFFSTILSLADLARLFSSISFSLGIIGFLVINFNIGSIPSGITGKFGGRSGKEDASLKIVLHNRSSNEWNVMTQIRPPGFSNVIASVKESSAAPSSSFTAIRIAWNTLFAGCPPVRLVAAGMPTLNQFSKFGSRFNWRLLHVLLQFYVQFLLKTFLPHNGKRCAQDLHKTNH